MKQSIAGLFLMLLSLSVQAFTLEDWRSWQAATPAFQSRIGQSRWLPETEIRVHADGRLLFTPYRDLVWQWITPQPRITTLDMTGQFLELTPKGAQPTITPLAETDDGLPNERQIGMLLLQIFQGDLDSLRKNYHLLLGGTRDAWRLALLPRDRTQDTPKMIIVQGGRFVDSLHVVSANDNELRLELSNTHRLVNPRGATVLHEALSDSAPASRGVQAASSMSGDEKKEDGAAKKSEGG